jgi:hypothetical protein
VTVYATPAQLKQFLRADHPNVAADDVLFELELEAACREIDRRCGRSFDTQVAASESPTARTFFADTAATCRVDDFWTTSGLVVATDDDDDGTAETAWTVDTDFVVEPAGGRVDGLGGFPFWRVVAVGSRSFPTGGRRRRVSVTARWGWEATPVAIERASLVATAAHLKVRDAPHGIAGFGEFGALRIPPDALRTIAGVLGPYRRVDRVGGI